MPRDSNGNYTLPASVNPVVSGTTITSNWANTTLTDIAQGITDSLDRSGRGGMLAPFRLADGSVALPGLSFTNETSTGLSRPVAGQLSASVTGTEVVRWTATSVSLLVPANSLTVQGAPSQITVRSTGAAVRSQIDIGRTGSEFFLGVSGGPDQIVTGDIAGDAVLRSDGGRILFGQSTNLRALIDSAGYTGLGHVTARGAIPFSVATTLAAAGTLSGFPAQQMIYAAGAANSRAWQQYVDATTLHARVVDDANSSAAEWLSVVRSAATIASLSFPNGTIGVGYVAPSYGAGFTTLGVNGATQPVFDLAIGGVRNATFTVNGTTVLLGTTGVKPLHLYTNNLPRIQILSTGEVGIGKTPTTALDILGTYALISNGVYSVYWGSGALVGGGGAQGCLRSDSDLLFGIGPSEVARFTATTFALSTPTGSFFIGGQRTVAGSSFALAINAAFSAGHGNSRAPDNMKVWLVCVTAEAGYGVGQRVEWIPNRTGFTGGYTAFADATSLQIYTFNATIQLPNASTGVATNITPANWQVRLVGIWQ
jgi:hypothetical protein